MSGHASARWHVAAARGTIRLYQLTLSGLVGRACRHLPTCSDYASEAIERHGLWAGGWMGVARICRCHPWGTHGYDPVPMSKAASARPFLPWRYGTWRGPLACEEVGASNSGSGSGSAASR
ncbi:MAG: membrane protein insertion efficiency factor YidD [Methylobacteriaceae bacterium]|nr:membrane protein insertion efficiency factor YidD [Methylobacteriaceae bacterium]